MIMGFLLVIIIIILFVSSSDKDRKVSTSSQQMEEEHYEKEINYFYSKVVGVTFENRQFYVKQCYKGQKLDLVRDRFNIYDKNAIAVYAGNNMIGFLSRELAEKLAPQMDKGISYICYVEEVMGGGNKNYGVNIKLVNV